MENSIKDIKQRWKGNLNNKCKVCCEDMVRHFYRNMDQECDTPVNLWHNLHHTKYDGDLVSSAGGDIKALLDIIEN